MEFRKVTCFNHASLSVNIPQKIALLMGIGKGDYVGIDIKNGEIIIRKAPETIKQIAQENKK